MYNILRPHVHIGKMLRVKKGNEWVLFPCCSLIIGSHCILGKNVTLKCTTGALLEIGNDVGIGNNCQIVCHQHISIGEGTSIAPGVMIYDHNHKFDAENGVSQREFDRGQIIIGAHCWLGAGVILVKGVRIGRNCVIGAGSVVVKDIPDNSLAVGNPARVIRSLDVKPS